MMMIARMIITMMTAMITMMTVMIILDQEQNYCCLVFVRKALKGPTVAKPRCKGRQKALPQDSACKDL